MPTFDIGAQSIAPGQGLLMGLDPSYQAKQQQVQQNQIGLDAATAFKGGFPMLADGVTPDYTTAASVLAQKGDYANADKFTTIGLQQSAIAAAQRNAGQVGQYGGPGAAPGGTGQDGAAPVGGAASPSAPGDYLSRLSIIENGGKDGGAPSAAGAVGRYQFTPSTWAGLAQQYPGIGLTPDGRTDPQQQQRAITAFTNNNISALGQAGIQATPGSLYLAHFAGAGGATAALKADPSTPVSAILGNSAVKANPFLQGMTAGGLVQWANGKMAGVDPSTIPGAAGGMSPEVASAVVRLRSGQGSAADGAAVSAYQRSRAQAGQPPAPGQASAPTSAPAGGQGQLISFGGPGASPSPTAAATSAPAGQAGAGQSPASPGMYATAKRIVAQFENSDPSTMTPDQQRAVTMSRGIISRYEAAQNAPSPGTVAGQPVGATTETPPGSAHPFGPGSNALQGSRVPLPGAPGAGVPAPTMGGAPVAPQQAGGGAPALQPISFNGGGGLAAPEPEPVPQPASGGMGQGQPQRPAPVPTSPSAPPPTLLDPSFAGQVPAAWLAAGHSAGEWVNYARAQAAINGALPFGAGKSNEEAWSKIADGMASSIDKGMQYTNEQRNARDAAVHQYESDKFAREQAVKLQAETDPSRVDFAKRQAAATAAGTAQGGAPYKFVPTTPTPGGPTVYTSEADLAANGGAVKDQPAVFGQKQEALGKLDGEMQGQFQERQVAQERLDAMSNLLETFQSGAGADAKAAAVAAVRAVGFNMPDSATASPAAVEKFTKNATANVFSNAKDMGGRVLVSELDGLQKANANPNMQPGSNAAIIAQQKGLLNWEDAHYQAYSAWRNANPYATDASGFEQGWAKANPVGAYVSAARKDIAPLGAPMPPPGQAVDGQAYMVNGQKMRFSASAGGMVPFSGITAPVLTVQGGRGNAAPANGAGSPPVAGARQAGDGNWYVSDPQRPGKFLQVSR